MSIKPEPIAYIFMFEIILIFFCGSALSWKILNCRNERLFIGFRYNFRFQDSVSFLFCFDLAQIKDILSPMGECWERWKENFIHFCARVFVLIAIEYRNEWRVDGHEIYTMSLYSVHWAMSIRYSARVVSASVNGKSHLTFIHLNVNKSMRFFSPTREACMHSTPRRFRFKL